MYEQTKDSTVVQMLSQHSDNKTSAFPTSLMQIRKSCTIKGLKMRVTQEEEVVQGHSEDKSKAGVKWHFKETDNTKHCIYLSLSKEVTLS